MARVNKLTRQERREMHALHRKVKKWARANMTEQVYLVFLLGLKKANYDLCVRLLRGGMPSGCRATDYQRDVEWPRWRSNFDLGFRGH